MTEHGSAQIESVVHLLTEVEKSLDEIKASVDQKKRELQGLAREEVEKAKEEVLRQAEESMLKDLEMIRVETEAEAQKILADSEAGLKDLKKQIDKKFQEALQLVTKTVLGE